MDLGINGSEIHLQEIEDDIFNDIHIYLDVFCILVQYIIILSYIVNVSMAHLPVPQKTHKLHPFLLAATSLTSELCIFWSQLEQNTLLLLRRSHEKTKKHPYNGLFVIILIYLGSMIKNLYISQKYCKQPDFCSLLMWKYMLKVKKSSPTIE